MNSKTRNHRETEAIDGEITRATQYGGKQCKTRHMDFWDFDIYTIKMKLGFWCHL